MSSFVNFICAQTSHVGDPTKSKKRYLVLFLFCLFNMINCFQCLNFAMTPTTTKRFYGGLSTTELNMLSLIYTISYIPLSVFSCIGLERIGMRGSMLIGNGLNTVAAILKLFVGGVPSSSYVTIMVAQTVASVASIFVLAVPPALSDFWFPMKQRGMATAIGDASGSVGTALGLLLPAQFMSAADDEANNGFLYLFIFQGIMCLIPLLGSAFLIPSISEEPKVIEGASSKVEGEEKEADGHPLALSGDAEALTVLSGKGNDDVCDNGFEIPTKNISSKYDPETDDADGQVMGTVARTDSAPTADVTNPPTPSTDSENASSSIVGVLGSVYTLCLDKNFMLFCLAIGLMHSNRWTWNSVMTQVLSSVYVTDNDAGQMGFVCTVVGCVASVAAGLLCDKYRSYKWPLVGLATFSTMCLGVVQLMLYIDPNLSADELSPEALSPTVSKTSLIVLYIFVILSGIPQCGITPIAFEFAMELTYGYPSSISGSILMTIASILSMGQTFGASALLGVESVPSRRNATDTMWLLIVFVATSAVLMIFPKNNKLRSEAHATQEGESTKEGEVMGGDAAKGGQIAASSMLPIMSTVQIGPFPAADFDDGQKGSIYDGDYDKGHANEVGPHDQVEFHGDLAMTPVPNDLHPAAVLCPLDLP